MCVILNWIQQSLVVCLQRVRQTRIRSSCCCCCRLLTGSFLYVHQGGLSALSASPQLAHPAEPHDYHHGELT